MSISRPISIAPNGPARRRQPVDWDCMGLVRLAFVLLCAFCMNGCSKPSVPVSKAPGAAKSATNPPTALQATGSATNETNGNRSFFDPSGGGKDPFFPRTTRLPKTATASADTATSEMVPRLPLSSYVRLTGLWPSKNRPMALINKSTFEPGERGSVTIVITNSPGTTETRTVQIRCLEVRHESVVITVEGETGVKELRMPESP